jgi:hypothetical protein
MLGLGNFITRAAAIVKTIYVNALSITTSGTDEFIRVEGNTANQGLWPNASGANRGWSHSFWVKCKETTSPCITTPQSAPSYNVTMRFNGNMKVYFYGNRTVGINQTLNLNTEVVPSNNTLSDWRHIVITFNLADANSSIVCYVDGTKFSVAEGNATYSSAGTWAAVSGLWNHTLGLGGGQGDSFNYSYSSGVYQELAGLDEISMYDEVLDQTQVNSLYNSGTPISVEDVSDYLLGWWKMGDGDTHPNLADSSGNAYHMVMQNMEAADIQTDIPPS